MVIQKATITKFGSNLPSYMDESLLSVFYMNLQFSNILDQIHPNKKFPHFLKSHLKYIKQIYQIYKTLLLKHVNICKLAFTKQNI